jgi:uncharacterized protein YdbL (DUF1318 family)
VSACTAHIPYICNRKKAFTISGLKQRRLTMKKVQTGRFVLSCIVFLVTSCITINIYFPAAAVEKAADRIVEEVWGDQGSEQKKQEEPKKPGEPQSKILETIHFALSLIGPDEAFAEDPDINVTTPAIRALKDSIQQRSGSITPFMDSGNAGIGTDGLLVLRSSEGLGLKDKAALSRLIDAENRDRETLYAEIAKANNFPPDRIADIKSIFAGSWIKNARAGWWIQDPAGNWAQK